MGLFSAIGGVFSSIVSGISSALGGAGGAIAALASAICPGIGLPEILLGIQIIGGIVSAIAKALGMTEEETPEELGMAAEEAELKPDNFDTTEKYIAYLREEVKKMDKSRLENLSDIDKVKYQAMGTAITIKGIEEKYGMKMPAEFWLATKDQKMEAEGVKTFIDSFKKNGVEDMGDMASFLKGEDTKSDVHAVSNSMMEALGKMYPDLSKDELEDKLTEMENKVKEAE